MSYDKLFPLDVWSGMIALLILIAITWIVWVIPFNNKRYVRCWYNGLTMAIALGMLFTVYVTLGLLLYGKSII
jgi:hypothetical protein